MFRLIPGAHVRVSCVQWVGNPSDTAHCSVGQPSGHRMPWNEITPGCSVLYWGPISQCPMYNRLAIGLTRHTVLWANCQDTEHPGMGSLQGVPSYTRGPYPSVLCTIGQQLVQRGTLEYGPTVRTWNTLEWDNSRVFHPIPGAHIQVSCVRLVGNWSDAAHWNMG